MTALIHIINHLIQQNPQQRSHLAEFAGRSLSISVAGFLISGRIGESGFLEADSSAPDARITLHNSALQKLMQGQQPGVGDISIDGDLILGMSLLPILSELRYEAREDLKRIFGGVAAEAIAGQAADIGRTFKQIGLSIAEQISDFSREHESPVIDHATLSAWMEEVDRLRDDVARLNARLDRLEKDIWL